MTDSRLHNRRMIRLPAVLALSTLPHLLAAFVLLQMLLTAPAHAQGDPWSAEVAVADRSIDEQRAAQTLALRQVLLANSGDKTLLNRDDIRAALRSADSWIERFDYRAPTPGTVIAPGTPLTDRVRESGEATQLMLVRFDRERLRDLIAGDADPAEGAAIADGGAEGGTEEAVDPFANLDSALVWLLVEDGRRAIMVGDPAAVNLRARAREIAGARGVTLRYPSGDGEDRAALSVADIQQDRVPRLRLASERYGEPVVLIGRLARDGLDAWNGNWIRFSVDTAESQSFTTSTLDEALQSGIGFLTATSSRVDDSFAYGGEASSDAEALVWFGAVDTVNAYATVLDFLSGVAGVGTVYPKEIDDRGMVFTVVPRGALPSIARAAESQRWLRRTSPPDVGFDPAFENATGSVTDLRRSDQRFARPAPRPSVVPLARNAELAFDYLR